MSWLIPRILITDKSIQILYNLFCQRNNSLLLVIDILRNNIIWYFILFTPNFKAINISFLYFFIIWLNLFKNLIYILFLFWIRLCIIEIKICKWIRSIPRHRFQLVYYFLRWNLPDGQNKSFKFDILFFLM